MPKSLPKSTLMKVVKPLMEFQKLGFTSFTLIIKHHCEKLSMSPSSHDSCLHVSSKPGAIRIVGL